MPRPHPKRTKVSSSPLLARDAAAPAPPKATAPEIEAAAKWLREADAVLVVAGAGLSAAAGQNVYADEGNFEAHYPAMARKWGVRTAYEAMGMAQLGVPKEVVAGFYAKHCHNMFYRFRPNEGYAALGRLVAGKDHFVLTSNVDGMFAKAGFDPARIYTPQGEMRYHQCQRSPPCTRETWESRALYAHLIPQLDAETMALRPRAMAELRCPGGCGGRRGPNLRGNASFVHERYQAAQDRLREWVEGTRGKRLVVLEVGAGTERRSTCRSSDGPADGEPRRRPPRRFQLARRDAVPGRIRRAGPRRRARPREPRALRGAPRPRAGRGHSPRLGRPPGPRRGRGLRRRGRAGGAGRRAGGGRRAGAPRSLREALRPLRLAGDALRVDGRGPGARGVKDVPRGPRKRADRSFPFPRLRLTLPQKMSNFTRSTADRADRPPGSACRRGCCPIAGPRRGRRGAPRTPGRARARPGSPASRPPRGRPHS
mmetsp:Transcript_5164/g.15325  ORF Transcript_5164/g.15325 Transcript_5164/m.15325 type:complete len:483 (+) Transcript_5164:1655-3103(+)